MKHARLFLGSIAIVTLALSSFLLCGTQEKAMVVVIPSYNNARWCEKNLASVLAQNYSNYRVIYVDDCSKDDTYQKVKQFIDEHNAWDKVTLIGNKERCGAMANWYNTIHNHCKDEEIVINVDGDDWLANDDVLQRVNQEYQNKDVWLTYGQFVEYPYGKECGYVGFPREVIENNYFREYGLPISHLRTYYAWLFKKVK